MSADGIEPARAPMSETSAGGPGPGRACRRQSRRAVAAALAAPGLVVAGLMAAYAIDVPFWDGWDWLARHLDAAGPLDLAQYWRLHNEHRVYVALLVDRWLLEAWGFSMWGRLWAKPAVVGIELGLVWALWRRSVPGAGAGAALGLALLLWSLTYWPLWVDPSQLSLHLAAACLLGALQALAAPRHWSAFLAAAGLTGLASVSHGPGLFAWPAGGVAAWMAGYRHRRHLAVWVALAAAVWASHAVDLRALGGRTFEVPGRPWRVPLFTLAFLGQPVAPARRGWFYAPTLMAGAAGLAAAVAAAWVTLRAGAAAHQPDDRRQAALGTWAALVVWALLSAVTAATGAAAPGGCGGGTRGVRAARARSHALGRRDGRAHHRGALHRRARGVRRTGWRALAVSGHHAAARTASGAGTVTVDGPLTGPGRHADGTAWPHQP